jgi:hypothetical protein
LVDGALIKANCLTQLNKNESGRSALASFHKTHKNSSGDTPPSSTHQYIGNGLNIRDRPKNLLHHHHVPIHDFPGNDRRQIIPGCTAHEIPTI